MFVVKMYVEYGQVDSQLVIRNDSINSDMVARKTSSHHPNALIVVEQNSTETFYIGGKKADPVGVKEWEFENGAF